MHRLLSILTMSLIVGAAALLPGAAYSACAQWDLSRVAEWVLNQHNGFYVFLTLQQNDVSLGGRARYLSQGYENPQSAMGNVFGTVNGNKVSFTVVWDNGSTGIYSGLVMANGGMAGETQDQAGGPRVTWRAEEGFAVCIAEAKLPIPPSNPDDRPLQGDQQRPIDALSCGERWYRAADGQCYPILN